MIIHLFKRQLTRHSTEKKKELYISLQFSNIFMYLINTANGKTLLLYHQVDSEGHIVALMSITLAFQKWLV